MLFRIRNHERYFHPPFHDTPVIDQVPLPHPWFLQGGTAAFANHHGLPDITPRNLRKQVRGSLNNPDRHVEYNLDLTMESAIVNTVIVLTETINWFPENDILSDARLVSGWGHAIPHRGLESFHIWFAVQLIWNACAGPNFRPQINFNSLRHLRGVQRYSEMVDCMVTLFRQQLNPRGYYDDPTALYDSNLLNLQWTIRRKISNFGIWSDRAMLVLLSVPTHRVPADTIRGLYYPYALAACRFLPSFDKCIRRSAGKHFIMGDEAVPYVWDHQRARLPSHHHIQSLPRIPTPLQVMHGTPVPAFNDGFQFYT